MVDYAASHGDAAAVSNRCDGVDRGHDVFSRTSPQDFCASTVESLTPQGDQEQRELHERGDEQIRSLREQFNAFKDSYNDMNFTSPYLSTVTARTFIIHGDRDQFFPIEIPMKMYMSIPKL